MQNPIVSQSIIRRGNAHKPVGTHHRSRELVKAVGQGLGAHSMMGRAPKTDVLDRLDLVTAVLLHADGWRTLNACRGVTRVFRAAVNSDTVS
jgi:hypothetical protein